MLLFDMFMMLIDANRIVNIKVMRFDARPWYMVLVPPKATKADKDKRTRPYTVRYSDSEESAVVEAAIDSALETASWIRMVSVAAAREHASKKKGGAR